MKVNTIMIRKFDKKDEIYVLGNIIFIIKR